MSFSGAEPWTTIATEMYDLELEMQETEVKAVSVAVRTNGNVGDEECNARVLSNGKIQTYSMMMKPAPLSRETHHRAGPESRLQEQNRTKLTTEHSPSGKDLYEFSGT
jgi:hypothetical protein